MEFKGKRPRVQRTFEVKDTRLRETRELVNWCFEPSQPPGIISGLKETFIKRYIVERTTEAEIRPEEQSEIGQFSGEFMERNTIERTIKTETDTRTE